MTRLSLITGATGFLGGHLARERLARGERVIAMGRNASRLKDLEALGATCIARDLSKLWTLEEITRIEDIGQIDEIVHCAALSSPFGPPDAFEQANVRATQMILGLAQALRVEKFIHISSPAIYARMADQSQIREDAPLPPPINAYAATKRRAEDCVWARMGNRAIILRPRGIYGKGDTALLPRLIAAAERGPLPLLRGGRAYTDITHVSDVTTAIEAAACAPRDAWGRSYNIAGPEAIAITEIVERAAERAGVRVRWQPLPMWLMRLVARAAHIKAELGGHRREPLITPYTAAIFGYAQTLDCSAARRDLGWQAKTFFEQGLSETFGEDAG